MTSVVAIGKVFRETTYSLEGDGALAFVAYDELMKIATERDVLFVPSCGSEGGGVVCSDVVSMLK